MTETPVTERDPFALTRADAELIEAEQEFCQLEARIAELRAAEADEDIVIQPVFNRWMGLMERIAATPPATLAGCAVKLRTLLHPDVGMELSGNEHDLPSLRQVLAFIERGDEGGAV
jgi:hypothetical protein